MATKRAAADPRRRANGQFGEGNVGNPRGRKPGIKERFPRGFVKSLVLGTITKNEAMIARALRRAAENPRHVIQVLDHAAKLNKEIGLGADGGSGVTEIHLHTNVNPQRLRRKA